MEQFLQVHKLGSVDLDKAEIGLRGLGGREELSRLFLFRLYMDFPEDKQDELAADKFMGQRVVYSAGESIFSGIVRRFAFGDIDPQGRRDCGKLPLYVRQSQ